MASHWQKCADTQCCGLVEPGERTTLDVFRFELTHVLGEEGVRELERVQAQSRQNV